VYLNGAKLVQKEYTEEGEYVETLQAPNKLVKGARVRVVLKNEFGQLFYDQIAVDCNYNLFKILKWLLILPFGAMLVVLLVVKEMKFSELPLLSKRKKPDTK